MKASKLILLNCLIQLSTWVPSYSQNQYCQNLGFEMGNFTNWEAYSWHYSSIYTWDDTIPVKGFIDGRHTIISDNTAYDANTGNELKQIPPGYSYSARLGRSKVKTYEFGDSWNENQSLRYTMSIDENNALLILKFALVLQYATTGAGGHDPTEEPRFRLTLYNQNGDTIPDCANYDVFASNTVVEGFHIYVPPGTTDTIQWRDWTTVGVDLTKFTGQTITIEFKSSDCTLGRHYGYAYFLAACKPLNIEMKYCAGDSVARLTAPEGFENYEWTDSYGVVAGAFQLLEVEDPSEGTVYSCKLTSATGCEVSVMTTINRYSPKADFGSTMIDCISNIVQLSNSSSTNRGTLSYFWDFGDGNTSREKSPEYKFLTSGLHTVSLGIINLPSMCPSSLTKEVESFSPPLVGISGDTTYCKGWGTVLKAYGAYEYTWSNGSKADSIEVFAPGGEFWSIGRSSTGCVDTDYVRVSEEPDWDFLAEGDTILCVGDSTVLTVSGAVDYLWSTGDTSNSILLSSAGKYSCVGLNKRGCEKINYFNVEVIPPPNVDFILSKYTLSGRENELTCSVSPQPDVQYSWDMGDGLSETGTVPLHAYNISKGTLAYTITLTATHKYGCKNSSSEIIDVIPFIPNIFSPNGDGTNDVFMPEIKLQVFDRNGMVIFKGTEGWDGKFNGQLVDPDTYFYSIFYNNRFGQEQNKKGYVTLVR